MVLLDKFEDVQAEIDKLASEEGKDPVADFENIYFVIISEAKAILSKGSFHDNSKNSSQAHVRLPKIDLSKFNGTYEQWFPFFDTFKSLIHENKEINKIQKFPYLKSTLYGDDAKCILDSLEISNDNYNVAWSLLKNRYDNERVIAKGHIRALFDKPSMIKESYSLLRKIIGDTRKHTQALKQPTATWDDVMIHLITEKLDTLTCKEWENKLNKELPTLDDLLKFLEHKCQILESVTINANQVLIHKFFESER